jgi:hypothetical protein
MHQAEAPRVPVVVAVARAAVPKAAVRIAQVAIVPGAAETAKNGVSVLRATWSKT